MNTKFGLQAAVTNAFENYSRSFVRSCPDNTSTTVYTGWTWVDPTGAVHKFGGSLDSKGCLYPFPFVSTTTDGSGLTLVIKGDPAINSGSFYTPSGVIAEPVSKTVTDTNGNQLSISSSVGVDQYLGGGRTLLTANYNNPASLTFMYSDATGASQTVTASFIWRAFKTAFGCSGRVDAPGNLSYYFPTQLSYPAGLSVSNITFENTPNLPADTTGRITGYTLPTGGAISFSYSGGTGGLNCSDASTNTLTRTTPDGSWTYVHVAPVGTSTISTTSITDPAGNVTAYTFSGPYEVERRVNAGPSNLLKIVTTCYNANFANCTTANVSSVTQKDVYTQLPNGSTSLVEQQYNSYSLPTVTKVYDYGVTLGAPPVPLPVSTTTITYNTALTNRIVDHPSSVVTKDAANNIIAETDYGYDETGVVAPADATPQHVTVTGSRGNRTTMGSLVGGPRS